jgi:penicillin-binding protein 2
MFIVVAVFMMLFVRLFFLQIIKGREYWQLSKNNSIRLQSLDPPRGSIFDRNGNLMVDNRPAFDLYITLKDAEPIRQTLQKLSELINVPVDELIEKVKNKKGLQAYKPILLEKDIGRDTLAVVEVHRYDLPGISVKVKSLRHYVNNRYGAHVIGYLDEINRRELNKRKSDGYRQGDFIGKFGAEKAFENYLRGERGGQQVQVDATGQIVRILKTVSGKPGHNIYLTIDAALQKKAQDLLTGVAGAIAAMKPSTGEILALASSPSFDQNMFVGRMSEKQWKELISNPFHPMENKAVQGEYPPASTFKIVTAMAGLEEGVIDEKTTFFCPGYYRFGDRNFRCWKKHGHGNMNVVTALEESCDVYFYQVGLKLGIDRLAWYAKACGLGSRTGVTLDHEGRGLVPTAGWKKKRFGVPWQEGETLSVAIGQGYNLATPLQMLSLTAAVANGGKLFKPLILKEIKIIGSEKKQKQVGQVIGKLAISNNTLKLIRTGLWKVVNGNRGTARRAHINGIEVCGKTGTAQVVGRKDDEEPDEKNRAYHLKPHAWFVAYAPSNDPQIAVAVIVEHGEAGSRGAAPLARELIATYFKADGDSEKDKQSGVSAVRDIIADTGGIQTANSVLPPHP